MQVMECGVGIEKRIKVSQCSYIFLLGSLLYSVRSFRIWREKYNTKGSAAREKSTIFCTIRRLWDRKLFLLQIIMIVMLLMYVLLIS